MHGQHIVDRFHGYIEKREDGCWIWTGPKTKGGLGGRMIVGERGTQREFQARRLSHEIHVGPTIKGKGIRLTCGQELCVAPEHLLHGDAALFWSKVNKDGPVPSHRTGLGPCWVWTTVFNHGGYGICAVMRGEQVAHRVSWILEHGSLRREDWVLHHCDNRPCIRPSHLFLGTVADNNADRHAKGRDGRGERDRHAKLTEDIVREIRSMGPMLSWPEVQDLARIHDVTAMTIWSVATGRSWKHVA